MISLNISSPNCPYIRAPSRYCASTLRRLWPSVQQVCLTVCVQFYSCKKICLSINIAYHAKVLSALLRTYIEEPPFTSPSTLLSGGLLYCNGKSHLACPNSSLAVIVNQCEPLQERGSLFPFVVIAVTAPRLLRSPACFTTPLLCTLRMWTRKRKLFADVFLVKRAL